MIKQKMPLLAVDLALNSMASTIVYLLVVSLILEDTKQMNQSTFLLGLLSTILKMK